MTKHRDNRPSKSAQSHSRKPSAAVDARRVSTTITTPVMWLLGGVGVLTLLHFVTSFVPGLESWSLDYWSDLWIGWRMLLVGIVVLCCIPRYAVAIDEAVSSLLATRANRIAAVILFGITTFLFRMDALAYGDGYSFVAYFKDGHMPTIDVHLATQYVDLVVHWAFFRYIVMPLGGDVSTSYAIIASCASLLSLWATVIVARELSSDRTVRRLIIAAALASGATVMFFGHVESYTLVGLSILWTIALLLKARQRRVLTLVAWGCWILAVAFHQLAAVLVPGMIWATFRIFRPRGSPYSRETVAVAFGLGFLLWAGATILYRMVGPPLFVPIFATPESQYTAFSLSHLIDQVNLLVFLAPIGAVALFGWLANRECVRTETGLGMVVAIAASAWMFSFWLDPLIGTFRDWDLLALFSIPLSIWAGHYVAQWFPMARPPRWVWVPVAALAIVHVGGFVLSAQDEMTVVARVDRLVAQDPHYAVGFFEGSRLPPWATVLASELHDYAMAKPHLIKAVQAKPTSATRWANLGNGYQNLGQIDSSLIAYEQAVRYDSTNTKYLHNLGVLQQSQEKWTDALHTCKMLIAAGDTAYEVMCTLGILLAQEKEYEQALAALDEAKSMAPDSSLAWYYTGQVYEVAADTVHAIEQYEKALALGDQNNADLYKRRTQLLQWSGRIPEAIASAREWEVRFPQSQLPLFLLGTSWYLSGQFDSAKAAFERTLAIAPNSSTAMYYLGSIERNLGQLDSSEVHLRKSLELSANFAVPFLELVYLYEDKGDTASAIEMAHEYVKWAPQDSTMDYLQKYLK